MKVQGDKIDEMSLDVPSLKGSMPTIHADTLNTPQNPLDVDKEEQEVEETTKDISVDISTIGQKDQMCRNLILRRIR